MSHGFLGRLTPAALWQLRTIVRDEMTKMGFPKAHIESDMGKREIDRMIDTYSQETAEHMIMRGMDDGLLERKVMR